VTGGDGVLAAAASGFSLEQWWPLVFGGGGIASLLGVWLVHRAAQRRNSDVAQREREQTIAERFDDASELARYIRSEVASQVEAEVERRMAPIRAEMATVKRESHEMNDAVRARETQLWLWDQRGRSGELPMLPAPILERLGLAHLHPDLKE
jgi:hypothetical protein